MFVAKKMSDIILRLDFQTIRLEHMEFYPKVSYVSF